MLLLRRHWGGRKLNLRTLGLIKEGIAIVLSSIH